ncbi:death-associated inhibitor of apoptosis 2-like [Neocloeon triangulifer]|uniref:death-associated inhibitor of apoptosis 2-like n=1 Tax=Neocloeon triangulifer TaxID=2078957 RepID=UPI00286F890A|nr:death-associated inhibitor of apoptosis 2-like [Neocloeon triangulifer]
MEKFKHQNVDSKHSASQSGNIPERRQFQHASTSREKQQNFLCDGLQLILKIALHRLFTFPLNFEIDPEPLAEAGLFYDQDKEAIKCNFCKFVTKDTTCLRGKTAYEILKMTPKCVINKRSSKNVPLGNIESVLNYKYESHRLYSTLKKKDWRFVTPVDLAKSGFYYSSQEDNCRCIYCNLEVRGWEKGDTPDGEHKRWNENCPFLRNPGGVVNIKIGEELIEQNCDSIGQIKLGTNPIDVKSLEEYQNMEEPSQ